MGHETRGRMIISRSAFGAARIATVLLACLAALAGAPACGSSTGLVLEHTGDGSVLCGNGRLDPGEPCDGTLVSTTDCLTQSGGARAQGKLHCTATCTLVVLDCADPSPGVDCAGTVCNLGDAALPCQAQSCPGMGSGMGCCLTASGPCGLDFGGGCMNGLHACTPEKCPSSGVNPGCCFTPDACGVDYGTGCVAAPFGP
jgi:hypothetical protein